MVVVVVVMDLVVVVLVGCGEESSDGSRPAGRCGCSRVLGSAVLQAASLLRHARAQFVEGPLQACALSGWSQRRSRIV